jgi:PAS domain S-box-containing protein
MALALIAAFAVGRKISATTGALGIDRKPTLEEFSVLFEESPNGVFVVDADGQVLLVNRQVENIFGHNRAALIGKSVETLVPNSSCMPRRTQREWYAKDQRPRDIGTNQQVFGIRADGTTVPIEMAINPIVTLADTLILVTVIDTTARVQAANSLAAAVDERNQLRRRLLQAQEEERIRLARELHDQMGQRLAAVMLELKGLEPLIGPRDRSRLRPLQNTLDEMGKSLHHVAYELRPAAIDELGLNVALINYIQDWSERYGIDADFHDGFTGYDKISDETRTAVYRIVQEALTNTAKHAKGARAVAVVLDSAGDLLQLTIEDDGCGFDVALEEGKRAKRKRLGLAGIRERLALLSGSRPTGSQHARSAASASHRPCRRGSRSHRTARHKHASVSDHAA